MKISPAVEVHRRSLQIMRDFLPEFMRPRLFSRRSAKEIGEYCRVIAETEQNFWAAVRSEFPETTIGVWRVLPDGAVEKVEPQQ